LKSNENADEEEIHSTIAVKRDFKLRIFIPNYGMTFLLAMNAVKIFLID